MVHVLQKFEKDGTAYDSVCCEAAVPGGESLCFSFSTIHPLTGGLILSLLSTSLTLVYVADGDEHRSAPGVGRRLRPQGFEVLD